MAFENDIVIESTSLRTGAATVYYQVAGEGKPLVLLHGLSGSGRWWVKNIRPLAEDFRVYVVDLVGFGRSRGQPFLLRESSRILQDWLDDLGVDEFSIAGHSMGGFVAADLAARIPGRVDRLILVDAAAVPIGRSLIREAFGLVEALRYLPFDFLPVLAADALRAGPVTLARAIHDIMRADMTADLSKIEADTMIIWGEHDTLMPLEMGERLRAALPQARFEMIQGAGHNPMWDRPEEFNRLVRDFLNRVPEQKTG